MFYGIFFVLLSLFETQKIVLGLFWHPSALKTDISIRGASRMTKYFFIHISETPRAARLEAQLRRAVCDAIRSHFLPVTFFPALKHLVFAVIPALSASFRTVSLKYTSDTIRPLKAGDCSFINRFKTGDTGIQQKLSFLRNI